jgi:hypothetical protein
LTCEAPINEKETGHFGKLKLILAPGDNVAQFKLLGRFMSQADDNQNSPISVSDAKSCPPFAETCRARSLWSINESAECLVPPPQNCEYVLSYGGHCYCQHPQRQEIVTRTLKISQSTHFE